MDEATYRQIEKSVIRKLDWTLVPLVMGMYLLAFLDRSNIGNANVAGLSTSLHMDDAQYQWLLTIFYISYIVFEWLPLMWKILPPHRWGAFCVLGWGIASVCQAATVNWSGMMALRFLMGMFEAGYGPGIPYLLSFFYLRHELGFRIGIFLAAAPLANTFAGALAYGITSGHHAIENWKVLFLVEGLPTVAMAPLVWFLLPDSPQKSRYLTDDEKIVAETRGVRQAGTASRVGGINMREVFSTLLDVKAWFTALMYFSCNVSFASLPVFLPTILKEMGFTAVNAQGLTAPPFFLSFLVTISTAWIADRTQQRGIMIACLTTIGGVGYLMLALAKSVGARYAGVFLAASGIFPAIANILPWVLNNQGSDSRRGSSIMLLNIVGQCGPLLGTRLYPANEGPFYVKGQSVCAGFMFFTTFLVLGLRTLLWWENKKLDKEHGTVDDQKARTQRDSTASAAKDQSTGVENSGPMFRYVL
ncbi:MFS general substrate transporter [Microthyrium microscopicum]|uniref:MFS general substrate transporter n=1 Tax=Microthyrium microscopicum TaxID=703497 RepID=A0A6A6UHI5_9PEZI|nr:MFS general substrate transporter [Microthyrium microscopicum]